MIRFALLLILGGIALGIFGYEEFQTATKSSDTPVSVPLGMLEAGETPENPYLTIGEHWALFGETVYREKSGRVEYAYYPIISHQHPHNVASDEVILRYEELEEEIPDEAWPQLQSYRVLVKTTEFKNVEDLPGGWVEMESITGVAGKSGSSLRPDEWALLSESAPSLKREDILIINANDKPISTGESYLMMGGGGLGILLGLGIIFSHFTKR